MTTQTKKLDLTVDQMLAARTTALTMAVENPRPALRNGSVLQSAAEYLEFLTEGPKDTPTADAKK
jgi:hypothetical protein